MRFLKKCELCGSQKARLLYIKNGYQIFNCQSCQLVFVGQAPTEEELKKYYSEDYFKEGKEKFGYFDYETEAKFCQENFLNKIKKIENFKTGGRLLDVGCAYGFFLKKCGRKWKASGIEISEHAAEVARKKFKLDVFKGTLLNSPWKNKEFDVITMWDVLDHTKNPFEDLKKINNLLKDQGLLVLNVGDIDSLCAKIMGKRWYLMIPPTHLFFFSKKTITSLLEKANFKVLKVEYEGKFVSLKLCFFRLRYVFGNKYLDSAFRFLENNFRKTKVYLDFKDLITVYAEKK